jgi:CDP-4-dehydro-6-deoxyglucose reductase, E3
LRVRLAGSDLSFGVAPGESVLDGALRAGLNLPHSCKGGSCGACRARLLEGRVTYPDGAPLGITPAEQADGLVLLCRARPQTELVVETFVTASPEEIRIKRLPCRVERAARLSHDVMALYLKLPLAEPFDFKAGQYVDIMLGGGRRRSFSIASPPHDSRPLELHVRRAPGGEFTERVFGQAGIERALLNVEGPLGSFVYRDSAAPMLLIGGGTGLAPLKSILRHVVENALPRRISLYWGVRGERDLYAHAELEALATRLGGSLSYFPVLSEPSPAWRGLTGYVHEAVLGRLEPLAAADIYASGPPAMIEVIRREFPLHGADPERVYFDSFDYAPDSASRQATMVDTRS